MEKIAENVDKEVKTHSIKVKSKFRSRMRLLAFGIIFGGIGYVINNSTIPSDEESQLDGDQRNQNISISYSQRDKETMAKAREERIRKIRDSIKQDLEHEFQISSEGYDQKLIAKEKEMSEKINILLGLNVISDPEKYK